MSELGVSADVVRDQNRRAWDALVRNGKPHTRPAADDDLANPESVLAGDGWLAEGVRGKRLLCLASGGGRQSALYAAAGAIVTVVDLSPEMLALDRQVAAERGLDVRIVQSSMDDLSALPAAEFDIVLQPVSTCYVPDVGLVYREVARVIAPGGLYISQHKQPTSLQASARANGVLANGNQFQIIEPYYRRGPLPPENESPHRESGTLEFLHRWEQLIGGMCRAGFVIEDLYEPRLAREDAAPGSFGHRSLYVPPYVRIKARRVGQAATAGPKAQIYTP